MKHLCLLALMLATGLVSAQNQVLGFEYWFDQNDAARQLEIATSPGVLLEQQHSPILSLAPGYHTMHYRLKDSLGHWSSVMYRPFTVYQDGTHLIVAMRYWTDQAAVSPTDMVTVVVQNPAQVLDILRNIDLCEHPDTGAITMFYQLKDNHGRWSSALAWNFDVDVVGEAPAFPALVGTTMVYADSTYTYVATTTGASWYEWLLPAGWTGSSITDTLVATAPGTVTPDNIEVIAHNDCGSSAVASLPFSVLTLGLNDLMDQNSLRVFPNPAQSTMFIELNATGPIEVDLFTTTGQQVGLPRRFDSSERIVIDVSGLPNGTYVLRCLAEGAARQALVTVLR